MFVYNDEIISIQIWLSSFLYNHPLNLKLVLESLKELKAHTKDSDFHNQHWMCLTDAGWHIHYHEHTPFCCCDYTQSKGGKAFRGPLLITVVLNINVRKPCFIVKILIFLTHEISISIVFIISVYSLFHSEMLSPENDTNQFLFMQYYFAICAAGYMTWEIHWWKLIANVEERNKKTHHEQCLFQSM